MHYVVVVLRPREIKAEVDKINSTVSDLDKRKRLLLSLLEDHPNDGYVLLNVASAMRLAGDLRDIERAIGYAKKAHDRFWDENYRHQAELETMKLQELLGQSVEGKSSFDSGRGGDPFDINEDLLESLANPASKTYVDLVGLCRHFDYPVSLGPAKLAGESGYLRGNLDPLEFLILIWTKMYNNIRSVADAGRIAAAFQQERDKIVTASHQLIGAVKTYEIERAPLPLASEIEHFVLNTANVRLPVVSFILRMLRPELFGTIDVRALSALSKLGFQAIKTLPTGESEKEAYLQAFSGSDYLRYSSLLSSIGTKYRIDDRSMWPSEVDMALYEYDKRNE